MCRILIVIYWFFALKVKTALILHAMQQEKSREGTSAFIVLIPSRGDILRWSQGSGSPAR